jgi:YfiH family protein
MPLHEANGLKFLQFDTLNPDDLSHGVFTRVGGVSPSPWETLNVGGTVGDAPARVRENQQRIFQALKLEPESAYDVWQVHSADVAVADRPRAGREHIRADIILTTVPGVTLFMRFADCVPILLYDPRKKVIGLAHAGWLGTVRQAARVAVEAMGSHFGSRPSDLVAALGPAIGPDHYAIGEDVISAFRESFGRDAGSHLKMFDGRTHLDLISANRHLLHSTGVESIEQADICTACDVSQWFSHRAEKGRTGRFGALFCLRET